MKIALIQTHLIWENPLENRSYLAKAKNAAITGSLDIWENEAFSY